MSELDPRVAAALANYEVKYKVIDCDPIYADTAEFCQQYGFSPDQCANTILVASKGESIRYAACVVLATTKLDVNKTVRQLMSAKKVSFASAEQTLQLTGMMIGGVTIFGLNEDIPIYVDSRVMDIGEIIMGGGNRSSKLLLTPHELNKLPHLQVVESLALPR